MYVYIYTYHICIFNLDRHATILAAPLPRAYAFSQRKVIEIADWSSHKKKMGAYKTSTLPGSSKSSGSHDSTYH